MVEYWMMEEGADIGTMRMREVDEIKTFTHEDVNFNSEQFFDSTRPDSLTTLVLKQNSQEPGVRQLTHRLTVL